MDGDPPIEPTERNEETSTTGAGVSASSTGVTDAISPSAESVNSSALPIVELQSSTTLQSSTAANITMDERQELDSATNSVGTSDKSQEVISSSIVSSSCNENTLPDSTESLNNSVENVVKDSIESSIKCPDELLIKNSAEKAIEDTVEGMEKKSSENIVCESASEVVAVVDNSTILKPSEKSIELCLGEITSKVSNPEKEMVDSVVSDDALKNPMIGSSVEIERKGELISELPLDEAPAVTEKGKIELSIKSDLPEPETLVDLGDNSISTSTAKTEESCSPKGSTQNIFSIILKFSVV